MKNKTLLTIIICTIVSVLVVNKIYSQAARPAPVSTMSGAASLDPGGKSTGTIDWSRTAQEIDGFGASGAFHMAGNLMDFPEPQRSEILDILFSQTKGAGLSIVRNFVGDGGT